MVWSPSSQPVGTRSPAAVPLLEGATVELRKEEGVTFDPDHNRLYVAISEISYGMEDKASKGKESAKYDVGGSNDIKVAYNPCGGVYALDLDQDYVATNMKAIIVGTPKSYPEGDRWAGNTCDMAEPACSCDMPSFAAISPSAPEPNTCCN